MAFWQRKDGNRIFVYFWNREKGKQEVLRRDLTRHLDSKSEKFIENWVAEWQATHYPTQGPFEVQETNNIESRRLTNDFCKHLNEIKELHPYTVRIHERNLLSFALPFLHEHLKKDSLHDLNREGRHLADFLIENLGLKETKIRSIHMSLRMFWCWLQEEGHVK